MSTYREDESMLDTALSALPLRIGYANMSPDPVLVLSGEGWGSNYMCDWLLTGPNCHIDRYNETGVLYTEENLLTGEDVKFLLGHEIIGITSTPDMINPIFHISGGIDLITYADTDIDPWVLGLPGITLVGSMGRDEKGNPLPKPQAGVQ
ncbi:hypothetical protein GCM10022198_11640 [Klugiella xanthotipulae]|uniref:Uncharacterized protein n=1 Tax=Klugiella xanthotipulae TaxID=244735 RepID=A0A543I4V6_9MICO|nr:hypothetical protein [Klugiella xanthotipulae]TQM65594.1 hypothetical protein FB466_0399 [Klugiella xanthotipulae]